MLFFSFVLLLATVFAYILFTWVMLFDCTVPELDLVTFVRRKTKKKGTLHFMAIYPHPDDETMMSGGTIAKHAPRPDVRWTVVSMTRGEHGDELLKGMDPTAIGKLRKNELHRACEILGVSQIIFAPFEDGTLKNHKKQMETFLARIYRQEQPDLVLTFERDGIYGHPDHVALSVVITRLQKTHRKIPVLYGTLPKKLLTRLKLPTHMADHPEGLMQAAPQWRVTFPSHGWKKYLAARCHQSQNLDGSGKNPLFLSTVLYPIEYYSEI